VVVQNAVAVEHTCTHTHIHTHTHQERRCSPCLSSHLKTIGRNLCMQP
jgi:hypothetical protein